MARHRLRGLDGRSEYGRLWRIVQRRLTEAIGGEPSPQEELLIVSAADLATRCAMLSRQILDPDHAAAEEAERRYTWFCDKLRRTLSTLGLDRRGGEAPRLADYVAGKGAGA